MNRIGLAFFLSLCVFLLYSQEEDFFLPYKIEHAYTSADMDMSIHYVSLGEGPLVIMLHGFPDYWYTWREQMLALSSDFQVVAMDLRGYNLSDKPKSVEEYSYDNLMEDVIAVINDLGKDKAIIIGHDWGGSIAWRLAMYHPEVVEKLVVCNLPHPRGLTEVLAKRARQNNNRSYAENFLAEDAHEKYSVEWMSGWVRDPEAKKLYLTAFGRSDKKGMFNYYKANFLPGDQLSEFNSESVPPLPIVKAPVLLIHGLEDPYLPVEGINNSWKWVEKDLTMVTIPGAGHFVQQDASDMVSKTLKMWLLRDN